MNTTSTTNNGRAVRHFLAYTVRYRFVLALLAICCMVGTLAGETVLTTPRYDATATLLVESVASGGVIGTTTGALQAAPTYASLVTSAAVLSAANVPTTAVRVTDSATSLEIGITATAGTPSAASSEANAVAYAFLAWARDNLHGSLIENYPIVLIAPATPPAAATHSPARIVAIALAGALAGLMLGYLLAFGIDWWRRVRSDGLYITGVWPVTRRDGGR